MNRREAVKKTVLLAWGLIFASLAACRTSPRREKIRNLSPEARQLIAQLVETLLPETDTPGARSAGVDPFVVQALNGCYSYRERQNFFSGLDDFEQSCYLRYGRSFLQCTSEQQLAMVIELDHEALVQAPGLWSKIKSKLFPHDHFFKTLKHLAIIGYFTFRPVATRVLAYDAIPGKWVGCMEMKPGQKGWATS